MFSALKRMLRYPDRTPAERLRDSLDADYREILAVDLIIWLFLLASIPQIAYVLGRGEYTVISVLKALGIDGAVWLLSRAVAKRTANRFSASDISGVFWTRVMLWSGIVIFLLLTTAMNTAYEFWDSGISGKIRYSVPSDEAVVWTHLMSSSFLAVIILFLSFTRTLLAKNFETSYEEYQALTLSARPVDYEALEKKILAELRPPGQAPPVSEGSVVVQRAHEAMEEPVFPDPDWPGGNVIDTPRRRKF